MRCKARGLSDRCTHQERPPQHFQSYGGQERLHALLSQNQGAYDREMANIADVPTTTTAFNREWIDYMVENEYESPEAIRHLFITVDPSSGKDGNYYAVTSMIFVRETCVVCLSFSLSLSHPLRHTEANPYRDTKPDSTENIRVVKLVTISQISFYVHTTFIDKETCVFTRWWPR